MALLDGRTGLADEAGASAGGRRTGAPAAGAGPGRGGDRRAAPGVRGVPGEAARAAGRGPGPRTGRTTESSPYPPQGAGGGGVLLSLEAAYAADRLGVCTGVMELMAMLSPAAVRRDLLRAAGQAGTLLGRGRRVAALHGGPGPGAAERTVIAGLQPRRPGVSVHGLVARVVRDEVARRGRLVAACRAAAAALEISAEALVQAEAIRLRSGKCSARSRRCCKMRQRPAADAGEELAGTADPASILAAASPDRAGRQHAEAVTVGEPLTAELERLLGPGHPDTIRAQNDLALRLPGGRPGGRGGRRCSSRLSRPRSRLLGADHPSTLASRNNLGSVYRATGRPAEAIPLFEQNAAACEALLGADHPKTVASRHSLDLARQESAQAAARTRRG